MLASMPRVHRSHGSIVVAMVADDPRANGCVSIVIR